MMENEIDIPLEADDPITLIFAFNEEMMNRLPRLRFLARYTFWVGIAVSFLSIIAFSLLLYYLPLSLVHAIPIGILLVSILAVYYAREQKPFLDEYLAHVGAINRARNWQPNPAIPEGPDHLSRLIQFLESQDDRFGYFYKKRPGCLMRSELVPGEFGVLLRGESGEDHFFDAYFSCPSYPWDKMHETVGIFIRILSEIELEDIEKMKHDIDDILSRKFSLSDLKHLQFQEKPMARRFILLQTEQEDFSDDVIEHSNETSIEYTKTIGGNQWDWTSPIELIAEDSSGVYNFGSFYFI